MWWLPNSWKCRNVAVQSITHRPSRCSSKGSNNAIELREILSRRRTRVLFQHRPVLFKAPYHGWKHSHAWRRSLQPLTKLDETSRIFARIIDEHIKLLVSLGWKISGRFTCEMCYPLELLDTPQMVGKVSICISRIHDTYSSISAVTATKTTAEGNDER